LLPLVKTGLPLGLYLDFLLGAILFYFKNNHFCKFLIFPPPEPLRVNNPLTPTSEPKELSLPPRSPFKTGNPPKLLPLRKSLIIPRSELELVLFISFFNIITPTHISSQPDSSSFLVTY